MTTIKQAREVLIDLRTAFTKVKVADIDAALVALIAELSAIKQQEPVGRIASNGYPELYKPHSLPAWALLYLAAGAQPAPKQESMSDNTIEKLWHKHCHAIGPIAIQDLTFARAVLAEAGVQEQPAVQSHPMFPPQGFVAYVAANYAGEVVFHDPEWHAKRLWNAAMKNYRTAPAQAQHYSGSSTAHVDPFMQAQEQRKPMTHEQRLDMHAAFECHKSKWNAQSILIDMVEKFHNIKEQP